MVTLSNSEALLSVAFLKYICIRRQEYYHKYQCREGLYDSVNAEEEERLHCGKGPKCRQNTVNTIYIMKQFIRETFTNTYYVRL